MPELYPLTFEPLFREYLWGGRRLETMLGKTLGAGDHFAESWEVVDHGADQSIVANGPLAGMSLHALVTDFGTQLLGRQAPQSRFPLLFKFLDAQRNLSVQVHPNDEQAALLAPPDLGKTEAWVVLDAAPNSKIYAGLKRGFDRHALERELHRGTCELCLHAFEPSPGDCVFIPAGTVHALGAGLLVAEIQQASDTTYRLFDWNRVDSRTGAPRTLHIRQALDVIDYNLGPVGRVEPKPTMRANVEQLVACKQFVLNRWQIDGPHSIGGENCFRILAVIDGAIELTAPQVGNRLARGQTVLIPAEYHSGEILGRPRATVLEIHPSLDG